MPRFPTFQLNQCHNFQGAKITNFSTRYSWKNSHFTSPKTIFLQFYFSEIHFPTNFLLTNPLSYNFTSPKKHFPTILLLWYGIFYFFLNALKSILPPCLLHNLPVHCSWLCNKSKFCDTKPKNEFEYYSHKTQIISLTYYHRLL